MKNKDNNLPFYTVIFDTNLLLEHFNAVENFINKFKVDSRVKIQFLIPDLVSKEYQHNIWIRARGANSRLNSAGFELNSMIGRRYSKSLVEEQAVKKKSLAKIKSLGISTFRIPYESLKLEEISDRAAFHIPPFQPIGDKGFKDTLIAEGVKMILNKNLKLGKVVVFICADEKLRNHVQDFPEIDNGFMVYQSTLDFETDLNLHLLNINDQLINEIRRKAEDYFSELYKSENVQARIHESYSALFNNPTPVVSVPYGLGWAGVTNTENVRWIPIEEPFYEKTKPVFIKREKSKYYWQTSVIYSQNFQEQSENRTFFVNPIEFGPGSRMGKYTLEFIVEWTTEIDEKANITSARVNGITRNIPLSYYYSTLASGASLAGQGTAPISD